MALDVKIDEEGCCLSCGRDAFPLQQAIKEAIADAEAAQLAPSAIHPTKEDS